MSEYKRCLRVGVAAIVFALLLRTAQGALPEWERPWQELDTEETETGREVRFSSSAAVFSPEYPAESPAPLLPAAEKPRLTALPPVNNTARAEADLESLLESPLRWQLKGQEERVLILHTHTTESYTRRGEDYVESSSWRTLDERYNMLSVGDRVEQLLEEAGIPVARDRTVHDYPSYNGSYAHARESLEAILTEKPGIRLVLDLHRDAAEAPGGGQLRTVVRTQAGESALLMLVMGAGFPGFEENLSLALKLTAQLENQAPGITRPIQLRRAAFNQDLSPGALLVEVGTAGNSHGEALLAAEELARAIIALAEGCN